MLLFRGSLSFGRDCLRSVPTTYTLTATGADGTTPATAKVTLNPDPSINSFTASTVWAVSGGAVTLSWETSDALSLNIDNGVGAVKPVASGSVTVRPTETTTYTLTATGVGGTMAARKTVTVKVGIETSLVAGKGEVARIPIVVGNGDASGNRWWSAQESGVGTLLTPNDLTLESDLAVKDVTWFKQADTLAIGLWGGSSTRPVSSRGAVTYFGSGGPAHGKSIFVFDGEQGYEFAVAASSAAGHSYINWQLGADSQAAAFLDGKTESTPMLIVIADTGAYPTLWPAVELSVGRSMPALTGQLARMEIRNVETSAARPYIIFSTSYGGAIASNLLWNDVQEVGDLQYGSDALAQGTNWADRIFYIHYGKDANRLEVHHLAVSQNNHKFWTSGGAGHNKSLYFCRVPGGSDFAGASCIEAPYSTFTEAGHPWTHWQFTSGDSRDVFMKSITRGDTVVFAIADPGQMVTPSPAAQLTASTTNIMLGQSATLTWSTTRAQSAAIDNGVGAVTPIAAGSTTVTPTATTTYTLTAAGAAGTTPATASVTITVIGPPTAQLTASGSTFVRGRGVRLDWSTTNAQSATIDNGVGVVTPTASGSVHVTTTVTTTYTLTATGAEGMTPATASVTVTVLDPPAALTGEVARMGIAVTPSQTTDASLGISGAATNVWNFYRRAGTHLPSGKLAYGSDDEIGNAARIDRLIWRTTTDSLILRMTNTSGTTTAGTYFRGSGEGTGKSLYFITASGFIELPHSGHDYTYGKTPQVGDDDYAEWDMLNSTAQTAFLTEFAQRATEQKFWFVIADPGQTPAAAQAPTARLTALESSIVRGRSTTLIWSTASTQSAAIDNGIGTVTPAAAGSTTVTPTATTTYTLTATGADGTTPATASITITVTEPPPTAQLTASASSIVRGQSATLNWTTANAQSATIDNGVGAVTPTAAGSTTVTPAAATTYTLTATGAEGTTAATASVTITVIEPPTAQLTAAASSVLPGQSTTLTWSAANALSAAIDNGVGAVAPVASGSVTVTPAATTTYTLTATGAAGTTAAAASVTVTVAPLLPAALTGEVARMDITVGRPLVAVQSNNNRNIDIYNIYDSNAQSAMASGGDDVVGADVRIQKIIWQSNLNTLLVRADDSSAADGETDDQAGDYWGAGGAGRNKSVYLASTAGEPLFLEIPASQLAGWTRPGSSFAGWSIPAAGNARAFMNALAAVGSRPRFLLAVADPGQTITAAGQPTARLTTSASSIVRGRSVTLTWSTTNAQSAAIDNGVGAVTPVASGSTTVTPTATTTYTLTATGATGTIPAMAVVTITVAQFLPEALTGEVARMDVAPGRPLVASAASGNNRDIDLYDSTGHRRDSNSNAYAQGELAPGGDDVVGTDIRIQRITWRTGLNELLVRADDYSATDSETDDQAGDYWGSGGAGRSKSLYLASTAVAPVFLEIPTAQITSWTRSGSSFAGWSIPTAGNERAFMNALAAVGSRPRFLFAVADSGQTITVAGIPAAQLTAASSSIVRGQSATLNWTTTNAQSAAIDNGVGAVTPVASGGTTVTPTATTTYTLTATGVSGTTPATASVTITVVEQPAAQLTAAASTIVRGQSATLNWTTANAQSAAIDNGVGAVTPVASGSTTVTPTATTTYTLTATGAAGTTAATASVTITVTEPPPTAQLTAATSSIVRGQSATLNWTTANAQSATVDNGVGAVTPVASGSTTVTPTATTTYTLTATGAAGTTAATASVTVTVTQWRASLTGQVARMDVTTGALVNAPTLGRVKDIDIYDNTRYRGGVAVGTLASGSDAVVGTDTNIQRITYRTWTTSKSIIIRAADATPGDSETDDQAGEYWASTGEGASKSLYIAATSGTPIFIEIPYSQIESGVRNGGGGDFATWTIAMTGQQADFMEALAAAGNSIHYLFVIADPGQTATTP